MILFRDPGETPEVNGRDRLNSARSSFSETQYGGESCDRFHSSVSSTEGESGDRFRSSVSSTGEGGIERSRLDSTISTREDSETINTDPYESLLSAAGIACVSVPVLRYEFINLEALAEELIRVEEFQGAFSEYRV